MKPRIFISMHYLEIGGAEMALIGLLNALDPQRVDVDLFLHAHRGELMDYIPSWVRLLPELPAYAAIESPISEAIKHCQFGVAYGRWRGKHDFAQYVKRKSPKDYSACFSHTARRVGPHLPSLSKFGHYDMAISFLAPHDYALHADASLRLCWIHTDYSRIDVDNDCEFPIWKAYDHIVSISSDVTEAFCKRFPSLRNKIIEISNITPTLVKERAKAFAPTDMEAPEGAVKLLTIGRFCFAKYIDRIPELCHRLVDAGIDAHWFIIGYGSDDGAIRRAIQEAGMTDRVHMLGKKENPYPYIAACDWYVQPSRFEGKSVVVGEAQMLGRPVIVTAYPTAHSQVEHEVDGIIVPMETAACAGSMAKAISDIGLRDKLITNIASRDYSKSSEVNKIYRFFSA